MHLNCLQMLVLGQEEAFATPPSLTQRKPLPIPMGLRQWCPWHGCFHINNMDSLGTSSPPYTFIPDFLPVPSKMFHKPDSKAVSPPHFSTTSADGQVLPACFHFCLASLFLSSDLKGGGTMASASPHSRATKNAEMQRKLWGKF